METKINKRTLKTYEKEIDRLMDKNHGELTPELIVTAARDKKNPLHTYFTWNDMEEANLWRLHKARVLFGCDVIEESPEVTNWKGKQTRCPYTCMSCGNKTGWSWIEPKHNCNNPMFDKKGEFNNNYKE